MNSTFTPACNSPPRRLCVNHQGTLDTVTVYDANAPHKNCFIYSLIIISIFLACYHVAKNEKKILSFVGAPVRLNMLNVPKSASASHKFSFCAWYSRCSGLCTEPVTAEFAIAVVVSMCLVPMLFVFLCILCCCKGCLRCCTVGFRHGGEMSPHSVEKYRKHRYF